MPYNFVIPLEVGCETLQNPENGTVQFRGTLLGEEAIYQCEPGFELTENSSRTCLASGYWSGLDPECISK